MKVLLLGCTPPPVGGVAAWSMRMLKTKLKEEWQISFIDERIISGREMFDGKIKYNYLSEIKRWLNIWKQTNARLKDEEVVIVHSCPTAETKSMLAEYINLLIAKRHKRKFIAHFRCTIPNMINGKLVKLVLKRFAKSCDGIIVLNKESYEYLKDITDTNCRIIPNFVDGELIVKSKDISPKVRTVVYVGGVIETKGCKTLIDVARNCEDIDFKFIGKSDNTLVDYAQDLSNVRFLGVKDKPSVMKELDDSDVFCFLSYYPGEGFSNALVEAMARGLPCITTDWAANADMIENEKGGFIVPIKDVESVIQAVNRIRSYDVRKQFSEFNINKVSRDYSERSIVDKYVDYYKEVCGLNND